MRSADPLARSGLAALVAEAGSVHDEDGPLVLCDGPAIDPDRTSLAVVGHGRDASAALRDGARAVLDRALDARRLGAALLAVDAGLVVVDAAFTEAIRTVRTGAGVELTPREREVLALLAEGLANKQIADRLGISEHTAKFHVNSVLDKLGAETRAEAVALAFRSGLLAV